MEKDTPPSLEDVDELDGYWTEETTITVSRLTKAALDEHRDGRPWDQYLETLRREHADPLTLNDAEDIVDAIKNELSMANEPGVDMDVERLFNRLDDLETSIPSKTVEELEARQ